MGSGFDRLLLNSLYHLIKLHSQMRTFLLSLLVWASLTAIAQKPYKPLPFEKKAVAADTSLWFSKSEVSIGEYDAFLSWLKAEGREAEALAYAPDDSVWLRDLSFNDPYAIHYHHHEAFKPYPVVGVSYEAANAFCDYMTATQGMVRVKGADKKMQEVQVRYRLPTEAEWMAAAGVRMQVDSVRKQTFQTFYPGRIYYPRDHKGRFRFNHKLGKGDYAGWAGGQGHDFEGYMITAPVLSFPPDEYLGLHNLAGNVAEMTSTPGVAKGGSWAHQQDDCRSEAVNAYERPMSWLGFRVVAEVVE